MSKHLLTAALALSATVLIGCGPRTSSSGIQWGALDGSMGEWLVDLNPSQPVNVCGDTPLLNDVATKAIKMWATGIGRAEKMLVKNGCSDVERQVKLHEGSAGPCGGGAAGCSSGDEIWIVNPNGADGVRVITHEIGHQWGLCDQYQGVENCAVSGPNGKDNNSVMGTGSSISADDIEGIRYLADLNASKPRPTAANTAWKSVASTGGTVATTGATGTGIIPTTTSTGIIPTTTTGTLPIGDQKFLAAMMMKIIAMLSSP